MIAAVITSRNAKEAFEKVKIIEADLYEVRIDYFESFEDLETLAEMRKKLILTPRRKEEGGAREFDEEERLELYKRLINLKPTYIDVELRSEIATDVLELARKKRVGVILSYHNFYGTPTFGELIGILDEMEGLDPDVIKIVTTARSLKDNVRVIRLYEHAENVVAFCMGPLGKVSRVFSALMAPFTYASVGNEVAPGQLSVEDLKSMLEVLGSER